MSKKANYQNFYKPKNQAVIKEPEIVTEEIAESNQDDISKEVATEPQAEHGPLFKFLTDGSLQNTTGSKAIVINAKRVNMRMDISKDAPVKKVLSSGTEVAILEKSTDGVWSKIKHGSDVGFMMSQYLKEIK